MQTVNRISIQILCGVRALLPAATGVPQCFYNSVAIHRPLGMGFKKNEIISFFCLPTSPHSRPFLVTFFLPGLLRYTSKMSGDTEYLHDCSIYTIHFFIKYNWGKKRGDAEGRHSLPPPLHTVIAGMRPVG
jgi:hypothetical protein